MNSKVGGGIAIVLLLIYAFLVGVACYVVRTGSSVFNDSMAQYMTTIGGLVSALVVAELAITKPGEVPAARVLAVTATPASKNILRWVTMIYLLVWVIAGVTALMVGMFEPKGLPALTSVGQSWFGLAVAAAYAYLGVKPAAS